MLRALVFVLVAALAGCSDGTLISPTPPGTPPPPAAHTLVGIGSVTPPSGSTVTLAAFHGVVARISYELGTEDRFFRPLVAVCHGMDEESLLTFSCTWKDVSERSGVLEFYPVLGNTSANQALGETFFMHAVVFDGVPWTGGPGVSVPATYRLDQLPVVTKANLPYHIRWVRPQ